MALAARVEEGMADVVAEVVALVEEERVDAIPADREMDKGKDTDIEDYKQGKPVGMLPAADTQGDTPDIVPGWQSGHSGSVFVPVLAPGTAG